MKTLIELRPGDLLYIVKADARIISKEVILISKDRIAIEDGHFQFNELDTTRRNFIINTKYHSSTGVYYINKKEAVKEAIAVQRKRVGNAYKAISEANEHHANMFYKLLELTKELNND